MNLAPIIVKVLFNHREPRLHFAHLLRLLLLIRSNTTFCRSLTGGQPTLTVVVKTSTKPVTDTSLTVTFFRYQVRERPLDQSLVTFRLSVYSKFILTHFSSRRLAQSLGRSRREKTSLLTVLFIIRLLGLFAIVRSTNVVGIVNHQ